MTKKLTRVSVKSKQILAIFMAVFLFSCGTGDELGISISGGNEDAVGPPDSSNETFDDALGSIRDPSGTDPAADIIDWADGGDVKKPSMESLAKSYLITKIGVDYIVLYINSTGTDAADDGMSDISIGVDANLSDALERAGNFKKYYDPRKLLFDAGGGQGLRMAWAGLVADPPPSGFAGAFKEYRGYDGTYELALGQTDSGTSYSVDADDWSVVNYDVADQPKDVEGKTVYAYVKKAASGQDIRAWFWVLYATGTVKENYAFLTEPGTLAFGKTAENNTGYEPYYNSTSYTSELSPKGSKGVAMMNNVNPPGKMLFGRKVKGDGAVVYTDNVAVFLSTVVGYNIRVKDDANDALATTLYGGKAEAGEQGIEDIKHFYMEFDANVYQDAMDDGYTTAENFPSWGALGKGDGTSIDGGAKVEKFTGILLKMK